MGWLCVAPLERVLADSPRSTTWMTRAEAERCAGFSGERRRLQFQAGRWLARLVLARVTNDGPDSFELDTDRDGRCLAPHPWQLSISHSGDWVGVAVANGHRVGLDLQVASPSRDWRALASFLGLEPCPDAAYFYRHWTLAEAWLKAHPEMGHLAALRGHRWRGADTGIARQGCLDDLHWAYVGTTIPQTLPDLLSGALPLGMGQAWEPADN